MLTAFRILEKCPVPADSPNGRDFWVWFVIFSVSNFQNLPKAQGPVNFPLAGIDTEEA